VRVTCENCFSPYERPDGQEGKMGCPLCNHVNVPRAVKMEQTRPSPLQLHPADDQPVKTMLYYPDADRKDDSTTAIQKAIAGKRPGLAQQNSVSLKVIEGDQAGQELPIAKDKILLGRDKNADICIRDSEVSSRHCSIEFYETIAVLKDLGSTNGTVLNGYLVREDLLKDGDKIQLGGTTLQLSIKFK